MKRCYCDWSKFFSLFFLQLVVLAMSTSAMAEVLSVFNKLSTPFMIVQPWSEFSSQYPTGFGWIKSDFWKWNPSGKPLKYSKDCYEDLGRIQQDRRLLTSTQWNQQLTKNLSDCEPIIQTAFQSQIVNTLMTLSIQLDLKSNPYISSVLFHLPNGTRVGGLLALKGDREPRPLVVLRMGVFSNAHEFFAERSFFIQLFEQSPFHLLLLESTSGTDFVDRNLNFELGGLAEGLQNLYIAKKLKDPTEPVSRLFSEIHLAGISFGGSGVLLANYLNDLQEKPILDSTLGICPMVDIFATFEFHQNGWLRSQVINRWAQGRLKSLSQRLGLQERSDFLVALLENQSKNFRALKESDWPGINLKNIQFVSYRTANDFRSWQIAQKTPLTLLWTKKDDLVPPALNSELIEAGPNVSQFVFQQGYHCSLAVAYDWKYVGRFLQGLILRHSQFQPVKVEKFISQESLRQAFSYIPFDLESPDAQMFLSGIEFLPDKTLKLKIKQRRQSRGFWLVDKVAEAFAKSFEVSWDLSQTDYSPSPGAVWSQAEKNMWLRYFQQKLEIKPMPERGGYMFTLLF